MQTQDPLAFADLFRVISSSAAMEDSLPDPSSSAGRATREYFENNWREARDGLLARTDLVRAEPEAGPGPPRVFSFEIDLPYKRKCADGMVVLEPGPIRGTIVYRPDVLEPEPGSRSITVFVRSKGLYHPNYSRSLGVLCLGDLPPGPFPLDALLEHARGILSYQNMDMHNPLDIEAVRYFARDPEAFDGLRDVPPLY